MITMPTVFVLGAGASAPYGFPLGQTLVATVCEKLRKSDSFFFKLVRDAGFPDHVMRRFATELADAGRDSIDAFLQMRPEYQDIGKACIAIALLPFETERELEVFPLPTPLPDGHDQRRARRWYHYLFNQMMTGGAFGDNHLSIVTFNFDRSLERALFRSMQANHQGSDAQIRQLCSTLPIVHVHGLLDSPAWLNDAGTGRQYVSDSLTADVVRTCAQQIQLVFDGVSDDAANRARSLLRGASRIVFLGFSYHPLNLEKLDHLALVANKQVLGTTFQMTQGVRIAVGQRFGGNIHLYEREWDILTFLQETEYIHQ
jgi:hypothetical protein